MNSRLGKTLILEGYKFFFGVLVVQSLKNLGLYTIVILSLQTTMFFPISSIAILNKHSKLLNNCNEVIFIYLIFRTLNKGLISNTMWKSWWVPGLRSYNVSLGLFWCSHQMQENSAQESSSPGIFVCGQSLNTVGNNKTTNEVFLVSFGCVSF